MPRKSERPKIPTTTRFTQAIAEELRAVRARENRTQQWLGAAIGRDQTYAGRVINGLVAPTTDELVLLCTARIVMVALGAGQQLHHRDAQLSFALAAQLTDWQPKSA